MMIQEFGNASSDIVLIQPVDEHDLASIENEIRVIREKTSDPFRLVALKIENWNLDLSPWYAPAVFGKEDFGGGAEKTLAEVIRLCEDRTKRYYIGGYSLAGLFALWSAYQVDFFDGIACASPSVWFPGFSDYMKAGEIKSKAVYLSLGDREEKTRNPVMATVGDNIREAHRLLKERGVLCTLEWNEGNHFRDADIRTAAAFAWLMNR